MPLPLKIEHRVGVQTPPDVIWRFVSDINGWPRWNPIYRRAAGQLKFGEILDLEVEIPGMKPRRIRPKVQDWTPDEQIIWTLSTLGGLIRSTRYIEIERLAEAGCIFSNGEIFEGPLLGLIGRRRQWAIKAAFTTFGEAVRAKAEAEFRESAGDGADFKNGAGTATIGPDD
jgi:hypothetical protein